MDILSAYFFFSKIRFFSYNSIIFVALPLFGQTSIKKHFKAVEKDENSLISQKSLDTYKHQEEETLNVLISHLNGKKQKSQLEAVRLIGLIYPVSKDSYIRQRAVFNLLSFSETTSSAVIGKIAEVLKKFKKEDYDGEAKNQLRELIQRESFYLADLVKIAGFLDQVGILIPLQGKYKKNKALSQEIKIALVRTGDENKLNNLIRNIDKLKADDSFIYGVVPFLIYARQKETFDFLFDIIQSNEKNCTPNGPDVEGEILCAFRVMEEVAPYVVDFPVKVGVSGDLETDNYRQALEDVRAWIKANRDSYTLRTDIY